MKRLIELKSDLVDLQCQERALGRCPKFTRQIRLAKSKVRSAEIRLQICRVVCLIAVGFATCGVSGCFEGTGRGAANLVRGVGSLIGGVCQDVGDGMDVLSE